ncbi:alpha/beta-hydrolase [Punctularia strigosozonata HHB-11173 SS5]|uniref:alpha/beta-hydrolase n=1 Tax=Punctularia strigosozonata (strain HHB-11173) TaxID=741275 RepID=UPI0004416267|nr:alpha/beta-hydrolase [Punctularia strigosozonata HHB-11173 SS5]EIN11887.1 alpha/beta-hydrolase [Punctularia strigosozonata HHB-11173 SS5]
MIDHLLGRPSLSWKRTQVFFVIFFWVWRITYGNPGGPRVLWLRRLNRTLQRFTPWQIIVSTLTAVYAIRNLDKILGLGSPEPLANLYSPSYYRATWIVTGLDAGFATAMNIRPKWFRDLCSVLFSVYYIIYAQEADEKLRRFRAVPTVEMLRTTWEKTGNPILRAFTYYPPVTIRRKILLPRPKDSAYQRPITAWLFFAAPEHQLARSTDLILDFPGGGFIAMNPLHHEERLRMWAVRTGKPVLSIDYGKAPEYPYPWAIEEAFDAYRVLAASNGKLIGMSGRRLHIVMSGDSAGATMTVNVMIKILETQAAVPHPLAIVLNYAALDFNFTSWMSPDNLRVLRSEQSSANLRGLAQSKDHLSHASPLSMVGPRKIRRRRSWRETIRHPFGTTSTEVSPVRVRRTKTRPEIRRRETGEQERGTLADSEDEPASRSGSSRTLTQTAEEPVADRVRFLPLSQSTLEQQQRETPRAPNNEVPSAGEPLGTRMTMTSRTGYFQDRIITPSMMRAMALLYIGPYRNPDFATDYHISPILTPRNLLAQFPPLLMQCGEKDPFVDDTVIFAGRVREAKRARKRELELAVAGQSAKFGEALRMSASASPGSDDSLRQKARELERLKEESEEDWVQMQIYSDWSHGYLQMPMLLKEARLVIDDIADWIDDVFGARGDSAAALGADAAMLSRGAADVGAGRRRSPRGERDAPRSSKRQTSESEVTESEADDPIMLVPKRNARPSFAGSDETAVATRSTFGRSARDSDETLSSDRTSPSGELGTPESGKGGQHGAHVARLGEGNAATAGKTGQTISEVELMRRRRLLDSHIFASG